MKKILLQTTIQHARDDWSIERFSILANLLSKIEDETGTRLFGITARDRENLASGDDRILSKLDETDFDQLWLFGVRRRRGPWGAGFARRSARFRERAPPSLLRATIKTWGFPFCSLGGIGAANHFHSRNPEPDPERRVADDIETPGIFLA